MADSDVTSDVTLHEILHRVHDSANEVEQIVIQHEATGSPVAASAVVALLGYVRQLTNVCGNMLLWQDVAMPDLREQVADLRTRLGVSNERLDHMQERLSHQGARLRHIEHLPGVEETIQVKATGACEFCKSPQDVRVQDMGEGRTMWLCASCRQHIAEGNARSHLQPCKHCGTPVRPITLWVDASFPYPSIPTNQNMVINTWQAGHVHAPTVPPQ